METAGSLQEVEGATAEEPPLGGFTEFKHISGSEDTPHIFDRAQAGDVAHTLSALQTASLLRTDVRSVLPMFQSCHS